MLRWLYAIGWGVIGAIVNSLIYRMFVGLFIPQLIGHWIDNVSGIFLMGFFAYKYGWNAKRFTGAPEQDIEAEVDSE